MYALFGRNLSSGPEVAQGPPRHMELVVDRQGYLRARWLPKGAPGWQDPARLLGAITELAHEPARAPAPTEHVH